MGISSYKARRTAISVRELFAMAVLFAVVVVLFFARELLSGINLFEQIVNDAGFYLTWFPPHKAIVESHYIDGYFPLWSNYSGLGIPINGVWTQLVFYPPLILTVPFGFLKSANIYLLSRLWLMGVTAYLFGRQGLKMTPLGAALAAVSFAFTGWAQEELVMGEMNLPWLMPLFAYAIGEQVPRPRGGLLMLAGLAGGIAILAGHPIQAFYMFFFCGAWWCWRWLNYMLRVGAIHELPLQGVTIVERLIGGIAAFVLTAMVSGIQWFPGIEVMASFWNYHPVDPLLKGYPVHGMYSLGLPWLTGTHKCGLISVLLMPYMGLIPLIFALFGITRLKRMGKDGAFFAGFALFLLGIAYNLPAFNLWKFLPGFNRLANQINTVPCIALCVAMLAGLALDYTIKNYGLRIADSRIRNSVEDWWRFCRWMILGLLLVAGYAWLLMRYMEGHPVFKNYLGPARMMHEQWLYQVLAGLGVLVVSALLAAGVYHGRLGVKLAGWVIIGVAAAGLWMDNLGWNPSDLGVLGRIERSGAVAALREHINSISEKPPGRVTSDLISPNLLWIPGFSDMRISSTLLPPRYIRLMARFNGLDLDGSIEERKRFLKLVAKGLYPPFPIERMNTPAGNLIGMRYVIAAPGPEPADLKLLYSGEARVYENPRAGPRAFVASGYQLFEQSRDVLDFMMSAPTGWEKQALFAREDFPSSEPWAVLPETATTTDMGRIEVTDYRHEDALFGVETSRPSLVVLADLYMPGWKAQVNGKPARILQVDYLLRGVIVPAGKSTLSFRYEAVSFKVGLWVTLITLFFLGALGILKAGSRL